MRSKPIVARPRKCNEFRFFRDRLLDLIGCAPRAKEVTLPSTQDILQRGKQVLIANYARLPVVMDRGEGCWLWDTEGRKILDLFAGFGGAVLGHCHPALIEAATK